MLDFMDGADRDRTDDLMNAFTSLGGEVNALMMLLDRISFTLFFKVSSLSVMGTPGYSAIARLAIPSEVATASACPKNPVMTIEAVGTPASSAATLARTTAGVQLPHPPTAEMTASHPCFLNISGSASIIAFSCRPWISPKFVWSTNLIPGNFSLNIFFVSEKRTSPLNNWL